MRRIQRTPSDEILLTELALDNKEFTIYDISSQILVGERETSLPYGRFKCYLDSELKEFVIEINENTPRNVLTRSTLLKMLDLAENEGASQVIAAFRRDTKEIEQYIKTFLFLGFEVVV